MKQVFKKNLLILLGSFFVLLGAIGILLPVLPTTPFLLVALALFANSSPRFYQLLLNNRWFGNTLKQWEESKTVTRHIKYRAIFLVILSFSLSIAILHGRISLQIMLIVIAALVVLFIWRLKEN